MKKFLPIIVGVLGGIVATVVTININVAHSELNLWNDIISYGNVFEWNDVFSPATKGKNLYNLAYQNLIVSPEKDALTEIAKKNGLTVEETKQVIDGSLYPLFGKNSQRSANLTQQDANVLLNGMQEDYYLTKEIFDIQREIDVSIKPSEIFSNGDLSDSGFDLIHDLNKIEELMFVDITKNTVGKPYGNQLKSPFLPTDDSQTNEFYVPNTGDSAVIGLSLQNGKVKISAQNKSTDNFGSTYSDSTKPNNSINNIPAQKTVFDLGDEKIDVNVLEDDYCVADDSLSSALSEYEQINIDKNVNESDNTDSSLTPTGGAVPESPNSGETPTGGSSSVSPSVSGTAPSYSSGDPINPAPADQWLSEWCPQLTGGKGVSNSPSAFGFGKTGFSSLGGSSNDFVPLAAEKSTLLNNDYIAVSAGVCFSIKLIKKKAVTFQPGDSCVLCEVQKINEILEKTLAHSLIPNKVTGNYMESAKCKKSFQPLLDLNIFTIKSPIPTPPANEKIYGRNVFDELKKYLNRYQPFFLDAPKSDVLTKKFLDSAPPYSSQNDAVVAINKSLSDASIEAEQSLNALKVSSEGLNMAEYSKSMIMELRNFRIFFENYADLINKMVVTCQQIGNKDYLD